MLGAVGGAAAAAAMMSGQAGGAGGPCELLLFPRYHLDMSSVLCRYVLRPMYRPGAMLNESLISIQTPIPSIPASPPHIHTAISFLKPPWPWTAWVPTSCLLHGP